MRTTIIVSVLGAVMLGPYATAGVLGATSQGEGTEKGIPAQNHHVASALHKTESGGSSRLDESRTRGRNRKSPSPLHLARASETLTAGDSAAVGQTAPAGQLNEVIVTATHRAQNIQLVPMSITALSGSSLQENNASTFQDYLNTVPGVSLAEVGDRYNRIMIRGISDGLTESGPATGTQSTTGIYIDDTPVTSSTHSFDPTLYDISRVEVLRGPQGTLYGSGSMGGTVRIILNQPQLDLTTGAVDGTWGDVAHGGNNYNMNAFVNVPVVSDVLAVRAVGQYLNRGGFIDDIGIQGPESNWSERLNGRISALYQPSERASILAVAMYQDDWFGEQTYHDLGLPQYEQDRVYPESGYIHSGLYSITGKYDFGSMNLTSVSSYVDNHSLNGEDGTPEFAPFIALVLGINVPPGQGIGALNDERNRTFSQEIRLASGGTRTLDWLVGGYFEHTALYGDQPFDITRVPALAELYTNDDIFDANSNSTRRQLAVFGETTYHATKRLSLTAGLRYSTYKTDETDLGQGILNGGNSVDYTHSRSSAVTPKYLASYQVTGNNNVYAQAAEGFRDGNGIVPAPYDICGNDLKTLGFNSSPTQYNPDKLWSYEVGTKNTFFDHRGGLNASDYYVDWKDMQLSVQLPTCKFTIVANAGSAVSKGFEIETWLSPFSGLRLDASISNTNAHITRPPLTLPSFFGNELPLVPMWMWSVSSEYAFPLPNGWSAFIRGNANWVDRRWSDFEGIVAPSTAMLPSYLLVGARIGIQADKWEAALYGTNLTDVVPILARQGTTPISDTIGEPRVIGLSAGYRF